METLSVNYTNALEKILFNNIKKIFIEFETDYISRLDNYSKLSIKEIGEKAKLILDEDIGEPLSTKYFNDSGILKYNYIPSMFQVLTNNLTKIYIDSGRKLDDINDTNIVTGKLLERFQQKAIHYRRWSIITNETGRTVKKRIKSAIDKSIREDRDYRGLRREIKSVFEKYNSGIANNTRTIARTELYSVVRHVEYQYSKEFIKRFNIKLEKRWDAINDERTRMSHLGFEKIGWIGYYGYFKSKTIRYPHDHLGEAKEVINCRCRLRLREAKIKRKYYIFDELVAQILNKIGENQ